MVLRNIFFFIVLTISLRGIKPDRKRIYVVTFIQHKCNIKTKAIYVCIWNKRIKKIVKKNNEKNKPMDTFLERSENFFEARYDGMTVS